MIPRRFSSLHFGSNEVCQQPGCLAGCLIFAAGEFSKPRHEIDVYGFSSQQRVDRRAVLPGQWQKFSDANRSLPLPQWQTSVVRATLMLAAACA